MQYEIKKDIDTRTGKDIYVMKIVTPLEKEEFLKVKNVITDDLNGYYSKFKKGFIFSNDPTKKINNIFGQSNIPKFDIGKIKEISIIDFCNTHNIPLINSSNYSKLQEHDSCVIYNNKNSFIWNSKNINGDIINFVSAYYNISVADALKKLSDENNIFEFKKVEFKHPEMDVKKEPDFSQLAYTKSTHVRNVFAYLNKTRSIDNKIISEFISKDLLRQDTNNNCVFQTFDENKNLIGLFFQGTSTLKYQKIDANSSILGFVFEKGENFKELKFFESPIDLMSYYDMNKEKCTDTVLISMNGLKYQTVIENIQRYNIKNINICVDNDVAGKKFIENLPIHIKDLDVTIKTEVPQTKDWNEDLQELVKKNKINDVEQLLNNVKDEYKKIFSNSTNFVEFMDFQSNFYNYSLRNQLLIFKENHNPQFILSEKAIKEKNLKLINDAKPIKIMVPSTKIFFYNKDNFFVEISKATKEEKELIKNNAIKTYKKTIFFVGDVYSIAQTNLPKDQYPKFLQSEKINIEGKIDLEKTYIYLKEGITKKGFNIIESSLSSGETSLGLKGYTDTEKLIVINANDTTSKKITTLVHEVAHNILHSKVNQFNNLALNKKNIHEIEAETASYIALKNNGIDNKKEFIRYINSYMKKFDLSSEHPDNYNKILERITDAGKEIDIFIKEYIQIEKIIEIGKAVAITL